MESKEVQVKAHVRVIKQRPYRFVCKECNEVVERICYPSRPIYCERCRPPKSKEQQVSPKEFDLEKRRKNKLSQTVTNDLGVAVGE